RFADVKWLVVSGSDQIELREILSRRGVSELFDGGIFGSPTSKTEIIQREIVSNNISFPALFIGDSKYDYECAAAVDMDFSFVYGWTEFSGWEEYFINKEVTLVESL